MPPPAPKKRSRLARSSTWVPPRQEKKEARSSVEVSGGGPILDMFHLAGKAQNAAEW
jgi:hypothetical protein